MRICLSAREVWCFGKQKTALRICGGQSEYSIFNLCFHSFDNHIFKQDLQRHGMAASLMGNEEFAIAIKNAVIVRNMMFTIVAVEVEVKLIEVESTSILRVTFCLFNLTYQSRIHYVYLLLGGI